VKAARKPLSLHSISFDLLYLIMYFLFVTGSQFSFFALKTILRVLDHFSPYQWIWYWHPVRGLCKQSSKRNKWKTLVKSEVWPEGKVLSKTLYLSLLLRH